MKLTDTTRKEPHVTKGHLNAHYEAYLRSNRTDLWEKKLNESANVSENLAARIRINKHWPPTSHWEENDLHDTVARIEGLVDNSKTLS